MFSFLFLFKKNNSMLACRVVCCLHQSDCYIKSGFESGTSHITAFGYHAPITAFGYWFLLNDVMESEGCAQWHWPKIWAHLISIMIGAFARALSRFNKIWKVCIYFCIIFKLKCVFPLLFSQCTHQKTCMWLHTMKKTSKV